MLVATRAQSPRPSGTCGGCVMDEKWWWKFQPSTATVDKCHTAPPKRGNPAHAMYRILSHTLLSSAGSVSSLSLSRMRCGRRPWATEAWWHLPFFVIVDTCQPIRIAKAILSQKVRQSTLVLTQSDAQMHRDACWFVWRTYLSDRCKCLIGSLRQFKSEKSG